MKPIAVISRPVPFTGSTEERVRNYNSHVFATYGDDEGRCVACDCKPWHTTADYPCGADVPRHVVTTWSDGTKTEEPE